MTENADDVSLYSDSELGEIRAFLRSSYIRATNDVSFARQTDPDIAVVPEIEKLRTKRRSKSQVKLSTRDIEEFDKALLQTGYAPDLQGVRKDSLDEIKKAVTPRGEESERM